MCETIEKYEKGKRSRNRTNAKASISGEVETLQQEIESLEKENKNLRKYMKFLLAFFITFYLLTVLWVSFSL
jgi:cell shape-determining protein MreC